MIDEKTNVLMNAKIAIGDVLLCEELQDWDEMKTLHEVSKLIEAMLIRAEQMAPVEAF